MANNKKVDQGERAEELKRRQDLEKLIQNTTQEITTGLDSAKSLLPTRNENFLDYHTVKDSIDTESKDIVISIAEFYLDSEIIERVPYVLQKTKVDRITVSSLLFQMKTAEHAIIKLLGEIDDGNLHPRTFEVLASLQRSKMEIVKHLAQFMIIMENAYKNFKEDYRLKKSENASYDEESAEEAGFRTRGSKALIQAMQTIKNQQDESAPIEEIKDNTEQNEGIDGDS
jgi:hypothetical protein